MSDSTRFLLLVALVFLVVPGAALFFAWLLDVIERHLKP